MAVGLTDKHKIIIATSLIGVAGVLAWIRWPADDLAPKQTHRVMMADVVSGELFEFDTSKAPVLIPERHPDSGEALLFPVTRGDDGSWSIESRYLGSVAEIGRKPEALDPARKGGIKVKSETVRTVDASEAAKRSSGI